MVKQVKVPSFGEQLIEVSMDDENQSEVTKVRKLFAEVAEIMKKNYTQEHRHPLKSLVFDHAVGEIISAHTAVEKVLTMKHYTEDEQSI